MKPALLAQALKLSPEQQLELVLALWGNIVDQNAVPPMTAAQAAELDRRIAEHEADPDDVEPWSEVRAAVILAMAKPTEREGQTLEAGS